MCKNDKKNQEENLASPSGFEPVIFQVLDGRISSYLNILYEVTFEHKNTTHT